MNFTSGTAERFAVSLFALHLTLGPTERLAVTLFALHLTLGPTERLAVTLFAIHLTLGLFERFAVTFLCPEALLPVGKKRRRAPMTFATGLAGEVNLTRRTRSESC